MSVRRTCAVCSKNVTKKTRLAVGPAVVSGIYIPVGWICRGHTEVYLLDPCPCRGADLFRLVGPRHSRGKIVLDGCEYVTWRGEVVRECPVCERPLPGIDPTARRQAPAAEVDELPPPPINWPPLRPPSAPMTAPVPPPAEPPKPRHLRGRDVTADKGLCRWCKKPVPKGRRSWCSDACVDAYLIRADAGKARQAVFARDRGICADCGLDCAALEEALGARLKAWYQEPTATRPSWPPPDVVEVLRPLGFTRRKMRVGHFWEADHIRPVVEGGGACGLENLRTLCLVCHRHHTAALAARRAGVRFAPASPEEPDRQLALLPAAERVREAPGESERVRG